MDGNARWPSAAEFRVISLATQGAGSNDHERLEGLLERVPHEDASPPAKGSASLMVRLAKTFGRVKGRCPETIVMEGSGLAGGLAVLAANLLYGRGYVVSLGDAIGPWIRGEAKWAWPFFSAYERLLLGRSLGVVGWSPYLVGRALTFGAPRGITVPGWATEGLEGDRRMAARKEVRNQFQIPQDAVVIGIVGSLQWNTRYGYCYGYEIVAALGRVRRTDVYGLIVGDGSGLGRLKREVAAADTKNVRFVGEVERVEVPRYLAAMDIGSLPQSVDGVGSFRYSTKLAEYVASDLPIVTGLIPAGYDLDFGNLWRMNGESPWSRTYCDALVQFLSDISHEEIRKRKSHVAEIAPVFDRVTQQRRFEKFLYDIVSERARQL
jgi:hypothetical protein